MRTLQEWFSEYSESHRNPVNKWIHFICVPTITVCTVGLFWALPVPASIAGSTYANWGTVLVILSLVFYLRLSRTLATGMGLLSAALLYGLACYENLSTIPLWQICIAVFSVAWVGQFIGHAVEGKKPSFFKDVQFLLIGPLWVISFLYDKLGIPYRHRP